MDRKSGNNEALEAVDFIINVLKEHEKDLDRLIGQLGIITESLGETGDISGKIEKIEDRVTMLQEEITGLIKNISPPKITSSNSHGTPVTVNCKRWEDFKKLATSADTISYLFKDNEKTFQANAAKNGRVLSYTGEFPENANLMKLWLSKELNIAEEAIFEGVLSIS